MSVASCCTPACDQVFMNGPRHRAATPGRLRAEGLPKGDRTMAVWTHVGMLIGVIAFWPLGIIVPLVMWLSRKDDSPFVDDHGREVVNFAISFLVLQVLLAVTVIGIPLIPVLWIVAIVSVIRGASAAGRDEFFRYPVTIRFIS